MKNGLILDTGTTISVVGNTSLVGKRNKNSQDAVTITTNGGEFDAKEKAHLKSLTKLEPVWYNSQVGANVLSFAEIEDHPMYKLNYIKELKCFQITDLQTNEQYNFVRKSGGRLYIYILRKPRRQIYKQ